MDEHEYVANYDFQELIQNLEKWIGFEKWGFKLIYSKPVPKVPVYYIVYQSNRCKIRFRWEQDRPYESPSITERYGRNHAPPNENTIMWEEEKHWCWHHIGQAINYFDGLSPMEDASTRSFPNFIRDFSRSNIDKFERPEYQAKLTAHIWEHYGERIFNLFDMRQPKLWNQYKNFVKESSEIQDERAKSKDIKLLPISPPLHKIC